jgi:bifunctional UDP-N-acetylglucosamine pyrophosphorylase/glucosamine-1-phosphate N-acetyltransferase
MGSKVHLGAGSITANFRFDRKNVYVDVKGKSLDSGFTKFGTVIGDASDTGVNVSIYPCRLIGNNCQIGPGVVVTQNVKPYTQMLLKPDYDITKLPEE